MTPRDDEPAEPRPHPPHVIGEPLDTLSVADLGKRIAALEAEIARLRAAANAKQASVHAAEAVFKR